MVTSNEGTEMSSATRFSPFAETEAREALSALLASVGDSAAYGSQMNRLGEFLGKVLNKRIPEPKRCLIASTAEDADYLTKGILDQIGVSHSTKTAVFWNNHYKIPGGSIAPVVHKFLEPGYQAAEVLIVAKSVISGSCVVRTNILELIESINPQRIFIVAPVMHSSSEAQLRNDFPEDIAERFEFITFAIDNEKSAEGEVLPGIGGEIYPLLGLKGQPAVIGFMPELVKSLASH